MTRKKRICHKGSMAALAVAMLLPSAYAYASDDCVLHDASSPEREAHMTSGTWNTVYGWKGDGDICGRSLRLDGVNAKEAYGAYADKGTSDGDSLIIGKDSHIRETAGVYGWTAVNGSHVEVDGYAWIVYGGKSDSFNKADPGIYHPEYGAHDNTITIHGRAGIVYGGNAYQGNASGNHIIVAEDGQVLDPAGEKDEPSTTPEMENRLIGGYASGSDADGNIVDIDGYVAGDIIGGLVWSQNTLDADYHTHITHASHNVVNINKGARFLQNRDFSVYGGAVKRQTNRACANDNTINIYTSAPRAHLCGGYTANDQEDFGRDDKGNVYDGNTLNVYGSGINVKETADFEKYHFIVPENYTGSEPLLNATVIRFGDKAKLSADWRRFKGDPGSKVVLIASQYIDGKWSMSDQTESFDDGSTVVSGIDATYIVSDDGEKEISGTFHRAFCGSRDGRYDGSADTYDSYTNVYGSLKQSGSASGNVLRLPRGAYVKDTLAAGYAVNGDATDNRLVIDNVTAGTVYSGHSENGGDSYTGNTLEIHGTSSHVSAISGVQDYEFDVGRLPGDYMLRAGNVDIGGAARITLGFDDTSALIGMEKGSTIGLLHSDGTLSGNMASCGLKGGARDIYADTKSGEIGYSFDIKKDDHDIKASVSKISFYGSRNGSPYSGAVHGARYFDEVYGGNDGNTLLLPENIAAGTLYGGMSADGADDNKAVVLGQAGTVYGGYSSGGDSTGNVVELYGKSDDVIGGLSENGNASGNTVRLFADTKYVVGGKAPSGEAFGNIVELAKQGGVYGELVGGAGKNVSGNILRTSCNGIHAGTVSGFDRYDVKIDDFSQPFLRAENIDFGTSACMNVDIQPDMLKKAKPGDTFSLISAGKLQGHIVGQYDGELDMTGGTISYRGDISNKGNDVLLSLDKVDFIGSTHEGFNGTMYDGAYTGAYGERAATAADSSLTIPKGATVHGIVAGGYAVNASRGRRRSMARVRAAGAYGNRLSMSGGSISGTAAGGYAENGNATGNVLSIAAGRLSGVAAGGFAAAGDASDNTVNILTSSKADIYGGYASGKASGNTVRLIADGISVGNVYGGYSTDGADTSSNKLFVSGAGIHAKSVGNFDEASFSISKSALGRGPMLEVDGGEADLKNMLISATVASDGSTALSAGDSITLLHDKDGIDCKQENLMAKQGISIDYMLAMDCDGNAVHATVKEKSAASKSKAPMEVRAAAMAMTCGMADFAAYDGMNAAMRSPVGHAAPFAATGGGSSRINTGSYVDDHSWNGVLGFARRYPYPNQDVTAGIFVSRGISSFDTHNVFTDGKARGDGSMRGTGAGFFVRSDRKDSGVWSYLAADAGRIRTNWSSGDIYTGGAVSIRSSSSYIDAVFGLGRTYRLGERADIDAYMCYAYGHLFADSTHLSGAALDGYELDAIDSNRLRLGFRYRGGSAFHPYAGAALEHEFSGDACGYAMDVRTPSPSIGGNTGIFDIGMEYEADNADIRLAVSSYAGERRGSSVNLKAQFTI